MIGRVLLLLAAFVVAGVGVLLVFLYARQADTRALADLEPTPVVVVVQPVAAGTTVADALRTGAFDVLERPQAALPASALITLDANLDDVVLADLVVGEMLVAERLGDEASLEALVIPEGTIATSFTFGDPNRVAGFVAPGSTVAVFITRTPDAAETLDPTTGEPPPTAGRATTRLLLPEAQVIAVGSSTTVTETVTVPGGAQQTTEENRALLTLALTQEQAQQLILGQTLGELYLGLLDDSSVIELGPGTDVSSLFEREAS